ncbi:MAG: hypothetical protein AAB467_03325 [Patescibacteria group bacterium]
MKKKKNDEAIEMVELRKIYKQAWKEGIFLKEFQAQVGFLAAAGSIKQLRKVGKLLGLRNVFKTLNTLGLGECVSAGTVPGTGSTRTEACLNAIAGLKRHIASKR